MREPSAILQARGGATLCGRDRRCTLRFYSDGEDETLRFYRDLRSGSVLEKEMVKLSKHVALELELCMQAYPETD